MKRSAYLTITLAGLLNPLLGFAQQAGPPQPQWDWPGYWHMWGGGWGFWWIFPLFMLLMMVFCFAVFFGGRGRFHHSQSKDMSRPSSDPTYSALQILNERYAKGEIQRQEYEEKKAVILSDARR